MKLNDLKSSRDYTMTAVECRLLKPTKQLSDITAGSVAMMRDMNFLFDYPESSDLIRFEIPDISQRKMLTDFITRRFSNAAQIINAVRDKDGMITEIFLHIVFFIQKQWMPPFSVILAKKVVDQLKKKGFVKCNGKDGKIDLKMFQENFCMCYGNEQMIAYTSGNYQQELYELEHPVETNTEESDNLDEEYDDDIEETEKKESLPFLTDQRIKLYGNGIILYLHKVLITQDDAVIMADNVVFREANPPCMNLGICELEFTDQEKYISAQTEALFQDNGEYLKLWKEYSDREGEALLKTAREVGVLTFSSHTFAENGQLVLTLPPQSRMPLNYLSVDDTLLFTSQLSEYLRNPEMKWEDYKGLVAQKYKNGFQGQGAVYPIKRVEEKRGQLFLDTSGFLPGDTAVLSILGDLQQISRREKVRQAISQNACAYPGLALLIEGKLNQSTMQLQHQKREVVPITPFVQAKVFPVHPPTDNQKEAIRVALNTPDIALIQGPPGTGKTTVINAIIERLNEMEDKSTDFRAKVLITSTQHDAVTNLTERMNLNGIPTPKLGGKHNKVNEHSDDNILTWCADVKKRLEEKYPYICAIERCHTLDQYFTMYHKAPSKGAASSFLHCARSLNISPEVNAQIDQLIQETDIEKENIEENDTNLMTVIRSIRTRKQSFADDGPETAMDAYSRLQDIPSFADSKAEILTTLRTAAKADRNHVPEELLHSLRKLKLQLMQCCVPKPRYRKEQMDNRIVKLYSSIKDKVVLPDDAEQGVIFEFYHELENNQMAVKEALSNYSFALGATLQQSLSKAVTRVKTGGQMNTSVNYDTVIVDEAARANPGDLLIPLSQASKRIILVGDHRQLPHMYKEEIFQELNENAEIENAEDISKSMFQHLWEKAKELEQLDHIKRTVQLDNQYRTHPLLGKFVSDEFYAPHQEAFHSPLPDNLFAQELYDSPLRWIHMPRSCGSMSDAISKSRDCEAEYIAETLHKYITSEQGKNLSYGVITFYGAQAALIRTKLDAYPECADVRIGSVDAFQGMEFDVIFLSVVRTESHHRRTFGFLKSVNRLCVAFSRQKKLLIVVGDGDMFCGGEQGILAEKEIPSMKHLYELCKQKGWVVNVTESQGHQ